MAKSKFKVGQVVKGTRISHCTGYEEPKIGKLLTIEPDDDNEVKATDKNGQQMYLKYYTIRDTTVAEENAFYGI